MKFIRSFTEFAPAFYVTFY